MDKTTPVEDSSELTRELLIAISDSGPDKLFNSSQVHGSKTTPNGGTKVTEENSADKLRSDLISISYVPSPDAIALPTPGVQEG